MTRKQLFTAFLISALIAGSFVYLSMSGLPLFVAFATSFAVAAYIFFVLFLFEGWNQE